MASFIVLIQVYNWEIRHHSLVCCCGFADILNTVMATQTTAITKKVATITSIPVISGRFFSSKSVERASLKINRGGFIDRQRKWVGVGEEYFSFSCSALALLACSRARVLASSRARVLALVHAVFLSNFERKGKIKQCLCTG